MFGSPATSTLKVTATGGTKDIGPVQPTTAPRGWHLIMMASSTLTATGMAIMARLPTTINGIRKGPQPGLQSRQSGPQPGQRSPQLVLRPARTMFLFSWDRPCAGINRHAIGNERVLQERSSESILTSSLAGRIVRCGPKHRQGQRRAGYRASKTTN